MLRLRLQSLTVHRAALAASIAALVVPILATRYLPFTDAPEHAAVMATLRHWSDPTFSSAYTFDAVHSQYVLYHAVGAALTFLTGDAELANRVLLAMVGVAFPLSFAAVLRALRADRRLALFACLPFFSRALVFGFLPFVAAHPLALGVLALALHQARKPTLRRGVGLVVLAIVLFYAHVSAYVLLAACAVVFVTIVRKRAAFARLTWILPSAILAVVWWRLGAMSGGESGAGRMAIARSVWALPLWIFDVWRSHGDELAAALWWCGFGAGALFVTFGRARRAPLVWYAPLACAIVLYLATPYRVGPAVMLNVRLAPVVVLFAVLPLRFPRGIRGDLAFLPVLAANLVGGATAFAQMSRARADLGDVDALLAKIPAGARVVTLSFEGEPTVTHLAPYLHIGSYHRVRRGGVASFSFSELQHWPLHFRDDARPPPKNVVFWDSVPCSYKNTVDGVYYDAVIVLGDHDPFAHAPPGPVFLTAGRVGKTTLFLKDRETPPRPVDPQSADPEADDSACPLKASSARRP